MSSSISVESFTHQIFQSNFADVSSLDKNSNGIFTFTSTHNASCYVNYNHPSKLPNGTVVKVSAKMRFISGGVPKLSLSYFTDPSFTQNKTFSLWDQIDTSSQDWQEVSVSEVMPIGSGYLQANIGFFQGPTSGVVEFKDVSLSINKPQNILYPLLQQPLTATAKLDLASSDGRWHRYFTGTGSISTVSDYVNVKALVASDQARLVLDGVSSEACLNVDGAKFVCVTLEAQKVSGVPVVFMDFFDDAGGSALTSQNKAISNTSFEEVTYWFAAPVGAKVVKPSIGFASANLGELNVRSATVSIYGGVASKPASTKFATLRKSAGVWVLDNGYNRYGSSGIKSVSASTPAKNIRINTEIGVSKPTILCDIRGVSEAYSVRVQNVSSTTSAINTGYIYMQVFNGGASVDPATLPDDTYITISIFSAT